MKTSDGQRQPGTSSDCQRQCSSWWLFIAGCVGNQAAVYDRFDAVVLLSAPLDVILDRVADRTNPLGSTAEAGKRMPTTYPRSSRCCAQAQITRS
jgi:hypothetical protein